MFKYLLATLLLAVVGGALFLLVMGEPPVPEPYQMTIPLGSR
ncbi:MAG: hypothetical protein ACPGJH_07390 [Alphaproteobacteria bacterium]